ncbi:MAG: WavE lipopolysaccharide synthesis family protein [Bdellovibrionales bacterium]
MNDYPFVKVPDHDISFVVQGPLGPSPQKLIDSIRRVMPKAELILSSWTGEAATVLTGADKILLSTPPEPLIDFDGRAYNLALQMVSTLTGIHAATRPYVYKMRSDHLLEGDGLCLAFADSPTDPASKILKGRLVVSSYFTRDTLKLPVLFHLSDLAQFGKKEDMLDFWSSPLPTYDVLAQESHGKLWRNLWGYCGAVLFREAAEQHLVLQWLARHGHPVRLPHPCAWRRDWFTLWEKTLAENFYLVDAADAGLIFPPRFQSRSIDRRTLLTQTAFREMCRHPASPARARRCLWTRYVTAWFLPRYWLVRLYLVLFSLLRGPAEKLRLYIREKEAT